MKYFLYLLAIPGTAAGACMAVVFLGMLPAAIFGAIEHVPQDIVREEMQSIFAVIEGVGGGVGASLTVWLLEQLWRKL